MIFMDYEDGNKKHENCSMMKGAIFMSNRKTKQECIKRKLFGLPLSRTCFIMKIKAGMLLFLFENEERKLYGVFEATSDGALNIVPNAFISSGSSFPAQVLFRRIWMCQPLFEHEFGDAIKENYYTHNKFNFGLSYEQVFKLVHLFSSRRIGVDLHLRQGRPNDMITEFEMSGRDKGRVTVEGRYLESNAKEDNTDVDLERYSDLSRENTNYPYFEKHFTTSQASLASTGCESYKMSPLAIKQRPPISMHPTFPDCSSIRGNFPCPSHGHVDHQYFPCSDDKIPSVKFGVIDDPSLSREPNTWITSPMENIIPHSRSQIRPWQTGPSYSSSNYRSSSFQISKIPNVSLPTVGFRGHPNLQDCKDLIDPEQYDPKNARIPFSMQADSTAKGMNSLVSMCYPKSVDLPSAQPLFDLREQQFQGLGTSCDYIPLSDDSDSDKNMQLCDLDRPYCSYYTESEGGDEGTDELPPYTQKFVDKYYPTDTDSRFHSDAEQSRSSVFSRLSMSSGARQKHAPRHRDPRVSLDQLRNMSQRREDILKANCHSTICDNQQEQAGSIVMKDPSEIAIVSDQLELSGDAVFGEMSEVPFMNFKRRSEIQRTKCETVTGLYVVSGNEESLGKYKRRKLVRPSLNEECENLNGTSREHIELGERNIGGGINHKTSENKNITSPEPSPCPKTESVEPAENTGEGVAEKGENQNNTSPIPGASSETQNVTNSSMNCDKEMSKVVSVEPVEKGENQNISSPIPSASPETENDINSMNHVKEISKTVSVESAEKIARGGVTGEDENENNPSPEPCLSAGTGNAADSSKKNMKEICNKNLRWFLERRM